MVNPLGLISLMSEAALLPVGLAQGTVVTVAPAVTNL